MGGFFSFQCYCPCVIAFFILGCCGSRRDLRGSVVIQHKFPSCLMKSIYNLVKQIAWRLVATTASTCTDMFWRDLCPDRPYIKNFEKLHTSLTFLIEKIDLACSRLSLRSGGAGENTY